MTIKILKILWIFWIGLPLLAFGQEEDSSLPLNNLGVLRTAQNLGILFKHYQDTLVSFRNPVLVSMVGTPSQSEWATTAKHIDQWTSYSAVIEKKGSKIYTLESKFRKGIFEPVQLLPFPWMGVEYISLNTVQMSLEEAIQLIQQAGFTEPFRWVNLFKPLHPNAEEIVYVFGMANRMVLVGTLSHTVTEEAIAH